MKEKFTNFIKNIKIKTMPLIKKILNLFLNNKFYLTVLILSIIILIVGSFAIGFLKSFLFIILIDIFIILEELTKMNQEKEKKKRKNNLNKDDIASLDDDITIDFDKINEVINDEKIEVKKIRSNEVMASNKKTVKSKKTEKEKKVVSRTENKKQDIKKKKKKVNVKKIIKIILIIGFILGIAALIMVCLFFKMIIDEAPEFNVENLMMNESSIIYSSNGTEMGRLGNENREIITYDELPEVLIDAIIATEDSRFFQHNGFDLPRFLKASLGQVAGNEDAGGASTLTMQIVKNAFTDNVSTGFEGIKRKFTDIYMSIFKLEKNYTKQKLLEFYVNYNFLGSNSYGVEQASLTYFNKSAKELNLSEAALIAGLYQSPGSYDPLKNEESAERAEQRRLTVLRLMERHGYITSEERKIAEQLTVERIVVGQRPNENGAYRAFIDMVAEDVREATKSIDGIGWDPNVLPLEITTTMDIGKQDHINRIMTGETFVWENPAVQAGIAVVDVKTGAIVAIGASRLNEAKVWNFATDTKRQIGSTAKPLYDYAPAIEYNNASTYGPVTDEQYTYTGGGTINNWDGGYQDFMTMREALRVSRNIPALKTFQQVNNASIYEMVTNLGLHPELEGGYVHEAHSIGAYTGESPLSLASAYAAFANSGYYNEPYSFTKVVRRDTGEVFELKTTSRKAMGSDTAFMVTSMLQDTADWALGQFSYVNGVNFAAKTGTTNFDDRQLAAKGLPGSAINDLWVAGYDSNYSIAVWYGYKEVTRESAANGYYTNMGNVNHSRLFQAVAQAVFSSANFDRPSNVVSVTVERETSPAMLPSKYTPEYQRVTELFKAGTEPTEESDRYAGLSNVTNLKATQNGQKITLTWTKIKTPNAIDEEYLKKYFNSVYTNPNFQTTKLQERLAFNEKAIGTIGYNIYTKDAKGELKLLGFTKDEKYEYELKTTTDTDVTFIVKTCYSIMKDNMSSGVETKLKVTANLKEIKVNLTTDSNITLKIGDKYTEPTNPVKVLENTTDVTSKSTIKIDTITRKSDNTKVNSITNITTTKEETYEIKYSITYNNETYSLIKTIKIEQEKTNSEA